DLAARDEVNDVVLARALRCRVLLDELDLDAVTHEDFGRALGCEDPEAELLEAARREDHVALVAVSNRDEHGAAGGDSAVSGGLTLGECGREVAVDTHDLTGRAHLRAEHRVDDLAVGG